MNMIKRVAAVCLLLLVAACGGGGSDSGTSVFNGGSGSGGSGSGGSQATYALTVELQRSGTVVTQITSTESVQAVATVKNSSGTAIDGVVVTFSESTGLIKLAPSSGTALTLASGKASIDVSAASTATAGAATLTATASIGGVTYTGSTSFSISQGAVTTATPSAINFVSVTPADKSIVIKGAGGNGRAESATLTFKVVDASNAPIKGATVNFSMNPAGVVSLNTASAVSNSDGLVTTTVQSGSVATSVVVTATADANHAASAPSDTLIVSTGSPIPAAFEIAAKKYNLDGNVTGDFTSITAYVADSFGNPVADGTAVSFTTDAGAVASSTRGGCVTANGRCSVDFWVQDPRGTGVATVIGTVKVGSSTNLSSSLRINMAGATNGVFIATDDAGTPITTITMTSCSQTFDYLLMDSDTGRSVTAGTTITASPDTGIAVSVTDGSPVLDSPSFAPTGFFIAVTVSDDVTLTGCNANGTSTGSRFLKLKFTTPSLTTYSQKVTVIYPK